MMQAQDRDAVALSARTLGALFSFAPDSEQVAPLIAALRDGSWQSQWPWPVADGLAAQFAIASDEPLAEAWQRLFIVGAARAAVGLRLAGQRKRAVRRLDAGAARVDAGNRHQPV